jgi:hypothetical protein
VGSGAGAGEPCKPGPEGGSTWTTVGGVVSSEATSSARPTASTHSKKARSTFTASLFMALYVTSFRERTFFVVRCIKAGATFENAVPSRALSLYRA